MVHEKNEQKTPAGLSRPISVRTIPAKGKTIIVEADDAERAVLAKRLGILAVDSLAAKVNVTPDRDDGINVAGQLDANVQQTCVVTLEPVEETIAAEFEIRLVPDGRAEWQVRKTPVDVLDDDVPDVYHNQMIDIGTLVGEHLALELDPYPRSPGAQFEQAKGEDIEDDTSPFAALKPLKNTFDR